MNLFTLGLVLAVSGLALLSLTGVGLRHALAEARRGRRARLVVVACPHLGLAADPLAHELQPTDQHRCYFQMQRDRVDLAHQQTFCLSRTHPHCPWLASAPAKVGGWRLEVGGWRLKVGGWRLKLGLSNLQPPTFNLPSTFNLQPPTFHLRLPPAWMALVGQAARRAQLALARAGRWTLVALWWLARVAARGLRWLGRHLVAWTRALLRRIPRLAAVVGPILAQLGRWALAALRWLLTLARRMAPRLARLLVRAARQVCAALRWSGRRLVQAYHWLAAHSVVWANALLHSAPPSEAVAKPAAASSAVVEPPSAPDVPMLLPEPAPVPAEPLADLLARGIAALEAERDDLAYELFVQACRANSRDARAWFWRAKTAPTLEEVASSLERAASLAPGNDQVRVNLQWARARLERERAARALESPAPQAGTRGRGDAETRGESSVFPTPRPRVPGPDSRRARLARAGVAVAGTAIGVLAALACLGLGALWIVGALPAQALARLDVGSETLLRLRPQLDLAALGSATHLEPRGGYDVLSALPFVLGFFALLAAAGLLRGEGWARWWAPLLAMVSVALWLNFATLALPPQALVGLCTLVAVASPLSAVRAREE